MGMYGIQVADGLVYDIEFCTSSSQSGAQNPPGAVVVLDDGRAYKYLKANESIAQGAIVTPLLAIDNADVDAAASDNTLTGTGDFTADEFGEQGAPYFVTVDAGASYGQTRRIRSNTANVLTVYSDWTTALTTSSDYQVWSPYVVENCDGANEPVCGIAISAISSGEWGWFQVGGLAQCLVDGETNPAEAYEALIAGGVAGTAAGFTAGGTTADEAAQSFGMSFVQCANADAAGEFYPVLLRNIVGY